MDSSQTSQYGQHVSAQINDSDHLNGVANGKVVECLFA